MGFTNGKSRVQPVPRAQVPVPESLEPSLHCATMAQGKESSSCLPSSHREPSLTNQTPFGSWVLQQFPESWGSPRDGEWQPGNSRGSLQPGRCHTPGCDRAQPLGLPGADTRDLPSVPPAAQKLHKKLWSPGALLSCRALAEHNKHSLTEFGDTKSCSQGLCL